MKTGGEYLRIGEGRLLGRGLNQIGFGHTKIAGHHLDLIDAGIGPSVDPVGNGAVAEAEILTELVPGDLLGLHIPEQIVCHNGFVANR